MKNKIDWPIFRETLLLFAKWIGLLLVALAIIAGLLSIMGFWFFPVMIILGPLVCIFVLVYSDKLDDKRRKERRGY